MIYLADVLRGQLDPVFSFKDEHKSKQDFKIKYNMYRYWNAVSVGYAEYHSIVMRTITLHTIHAGAPETYSKSNNIKKNVNRNLIDNRGLERSNATVIFTITNKSTYYLFYDNFTQKHIQLYSIFNFVTNFGFTS